MIKLILLCLLLLQPAMSIADQDVETKINVGSTSYLSLTFLENGSLFAPDALKWWVYDELTGTVTYVVQDCTSISHDTCLPVATWGASMTLLMPPEANAMINTSRETEKHIVSIVARYASNKFITKKVRYIVVNDKKVIVTTTPAPNITPTATNTPTNTP